jgi:hypothetical protein
MIRTQCNCPPTRDKGLVELSGLPQDVPEIVDCFQKIRLDRNSITICGDRFFESLPVLQRITEAKVSHGHTGLASNGTVECFDCFVDPSATAEYVC